MSPFGIFGQSVEDALAQEVAHMGVVGLEGAGYQTEAPMTTEEAAAMEDAYGPTATEMAAAMEDAYGGYGGGGPSGGGTGPGGTGGGPGGGPGTGGGVGDDAGSPF